MKSSTKQILTTMNIISWVLFIGVCIKTGAILFSFFVSLFINAVAAENLHLGRLNLADLYHFSLGHYVSLVVAIILLWVLKAFIFYLIIRIFLKIKFVHPFSTEVCSLRSKTSYVAVGIGTLTIVANRIVNG